MFTVRKLICSFLLTATVLAVMPASAAPVTSTVAKITKAAEQGSADAQFNLGVMYANGQGVPENLATAIQWYEKAAEQGSA